VLVGVRAGTACCAVGTSINELSALKSSVLSGEQKSKLQFWLEKGNAALLRSAARCPHWRRMKASAAGAVAPGQVSSAERAVEEM